MLVLSVCKERSLGFGLRVSGFRVLGPRPLGQLMCGLGARRSGFGTLCDDLPDLPRMGSDAYGAGYGVEGPRV